MTAYVILIGSEEGHAAGDFIGPFDNHDSAQSWCDESEVLLTDWREVQASSFGGYPSVYIVSDQSCDYSPFGWKKMWRGLMDDMSDCCDDPVCLHGL